MSTVAKEIKTFKVKIEERVSKKGTTYRMIMVEVNGVWKDVTFLSTEFEFDLYKAGIKI